MQLLEFRGIGKQSLIRPMRLGLQVLFLFFLMLMCVPLDSCVSISLSHVWSLKFFLCLIAGFPLVQTKIVDFFRIQRSTESTQKLNHGKVHWSFPWWLFFRQSITFFTNWNWFTFLLGFWFVNFISLDGQKKRKRSSSLVMSKKKRKLLPFNPTEDPSRRMEQMASLATALTATGTEFSNELTYMPGTAPRSANQSILEHGGMQVSDLIRKHSRLGQVN